MRPVTLLAALLVAIASGCLPHALSRPDPAPAILPCAAADCLRVLTWNVHAIPFVAPRTSARLRNVAAKIREQQPDVALLQEVWAHAYARQLVRDLGGAYRSVAATGCRRPFPCGGLVVLVRRASGWAPSAPTFVAYDHSAPWYRLAEWDGIAKKGFLATELVRGGAVIAVVDTHLQTEYARRRRDYSDIRRRQFDQLSTALARRFGDRPVVLGGDFNTAPGDRSGLYERRLVLLGTDRTTDLRVACGECGTRPARPRPARWLDYVLTRNLPAASAADRIVNRRVDDPFSDHDAVLVRLESTDPARP
ncbi:MAG: endonuclease/exonuclease/phosphatase family protein [Deltaproteobacteria bacterium]|nr:endonuclease/exonuclease/phosphatase family protein [Deltaproteobacteria bacterium]